MQVLWTVYPVQNYRKRELYMSKQIAEITGDVFEPRNPDLMDTHYFLLKSGKTEFLLSLENVLECLKFSEKEGIVPEINSDWWCAMITTYPDLADPVEVDYSDDSLV